jgi:hypothetical protein
MAQSNLAVISENGVFNVKSAVKNAMLPKAKQPINDAVMYNQEGILLTTTTYQGNSLGEAIDAQAKAYKSIKKQQKAALEKLKSIGEVLNYVRSLFKSDLLFGQFLMKTELSIMSRQDRSDAMWLADNWDEIQLQMKKLDISSSSASYLRQAIRKATATVQRSEAPDVVAVATVEPQAKPTATVQESKASPVVAVATVEPSTLETKPTATVQESLESKIPSKASPVVEKPVAATVEPSTVTPTVQESKASPVVDTLEIIVDNAEAFADSIVMLAKSENLDLNAVIEALLKRV